MKDIINKYIDQEVKAIKNIPINGIIENVIDVIFQNVHLKNGKVVSQKVGASDYKTVSDWVKENI